MGTSLCSIIAYKDLNGMKLGSRRELDSYRFICMGDRRSRGGVTQKRLGVIMHYSHFLLTLHFCLPNTSIPTQSSTDLLQGLMLELIMLCSHTSFHLYLTYTPSSNTSIPNSICHRPTIRLNSMILANIITGSMSDLEGKSERII